MKAAAVEARLHGSAALGHAPHRPVLVMLDTNIAGTVWPIRAAVTEMVKAGRGDIVMVASGQGLVRVVEDAAVDAQPRVRDERVEATGPLERGGHEAPAVVGGPDVRLDGDRTARVLGLQGVEALAAARAQDDASARADQLPSGGPADSGTGTRDRDDGIGERLDVVGRPVRCVRGADIIAGSRPTRRAVTPPRAGARRGRRSGRPVDSRGRGRRPAPRPCRAARPRHRRASSSRRRRRRHGRPR